MVTPTTAQLPDILTLEEAAQYLRLTSEELQTELEAGNILGRKIAGKWRIPRSSLDNLFNFSSSPSPTEPPPLTPPTENFATPSLAPDTQQLPSPIIDPTPSPSPITDIPPIDIPDPTPSQSEISPTTEPLPPSLPPSPPPGRVWAKVHSSNIKQKYGSARLLLDNHYVWFDFNQLLKESPTPFPGDIIEFEPSRSPKGRLEARSISVVRPQTTSNTPLPQPTPNKIAPPPSPVSPIVLAPESIEPFSTLPKNVSINGTPESEKIYQKAAVAVTEGRYDDARKLFNQAIKAGAGVQIYSAFFKMEQENRKLADARRIIQQALTQFPNYSNFYVMYGQMERRRARSYKRAEEIFRQGLVKFPDDISINHGLAQTLVQIGTEQSFKEAGQIFDWLKGRGKLDTNDTLYHRYKSLEKNPRANKAYDFFQNAGLRIVGIAGQRDLPWYITDIVAETDDQELNESFGLTGAFLVRCFRRPSSAKDILDLSKFLRGLGSEDVIGLQGAREVILNPSVAFIAVPKLDAVRDQIMSILSENNEAIVPLDDAILEDSETPLQTLRELLGQYLGRRDLYNSSFPVSGRRFFGREKLLLQLTDEVKNGQFLGIYGLRKMGKTSLIYQLRDEKLRGEAVAYVDLQANPAKIVGNCNPLYWELGRSLYLRLQYKHPELASSLRLGKVEKFSDLPNRGEAAGLIFNEDIRIVLDKLSQDEVLGVKRLVFVLDELEQILPTAGQKGVEGYLEFFGFLRGLAQSERYRGYLSTVVVAANAAISERGYWEGRENPVFALYKSIFLPPLLRDECAGMIKTLGKSMSVYWEDEAIELLFAETNGHPFLTRVFCSRIAKEYSTRPLTVTKEMVQSQILPFIRDEGNKLEQIIELLQTHFPKERQLLEQIALNELKQELSDESVRHLLGYHLIVAKGHGYCLTLNLLNRWLRRQAGIKE